MSGAEDIRLGELRIHVAPAVTPTGAGVVLYPTIFGLNPPMRAFASELAEAGLTAVVWDPYNGEDGTKDPAEMVARSKRCEDRAVLHDLSVVVDYMQEELGLSAIGGLGWCFGGRLGLLHAGTDRRIVALAAYNPTIWHPTPIVADGVARSRADFPEQTLDEFELAASVRGPVQICRPEDDFTQPDEYVKLMDSLYRRPDPTILEFFPGAEHAFSYKPGDANARAHQFAWASTLFLFSRALGES